MSQRSFSFMFTFGVPVSKSQFVSQFLFTFGVPVSVSQCWSPSLFSFTFSFSFTLTFLFTLTFGVPISVSKFRFTFGVPISCPSFSLRLESQFRVPICFKKGREGAKETKKEERVQHWDFPGGHPS